MFIINNFFNKDNLYYYNKNIMNNYNEIYSIYVQSLFSMSFDEIIKKFDNSYFSWNKFEKIFIYLYNQIINSKNENDLITNYYLFTFIYLNYTNYLSYSSHPDFDNPLVYKIINKIKYNKNIISKLLKYNKNPIINKIIKITNPFVNTLSKYHKLNNSDYFDKFLNDYLINSKQMEKMSEMSNDTLKKSLNIIIFRNIISKKNNYLNYSDFYLKNIIDKNNLNILLDFDTFINKISMSRKILDIKTKNSDFNTNIKVIDVINFLLTKFEKINIQIQKDKYVISNNKFGGKVFVVFNSNTTSIEFNKHQTNYSLIYYNTEQIKNFNFLNKTSSFVEIKLNSNIITDLSSLLDIIHLLTISFKMLESYPSDIYECLYPIDYTNYYFLSYCMFFEFVKPQIKNSLSINKFIIDLFKYYYIYAYYDYYFYHSNNLIDGLMSSYSYKNNIFQDFVQNLKTTLKVPKELFAYPPFFDISDDLDSLIYYSFEIPSYLKLFDFINAICYVFDKNYYTKYPQDIDFEKIIYKYFITLQPQTQPNIQKQNQNQLKTYSNKFVNNEELISSDSDSNISTQISETPRIKNNKSYNKSNKSKILSSNTSDSDSNSYFDSQTQTQTQTQTQSESNISECDDLKSRLNHDQISTLSSKDKKLMHNTNTYIELNIENSVNYGLDTDK